ncbi:CheW-like domain protein [Calothrix sp. NIES-4071]|nr:CheW-like domain protein [Calothrix sp. NIES-4071]BAZ63659.1 CheW-like domain protein [Calothrix sp. NIES-4105]
MEHIDSDDIKAFLAESYENLNQIENDIVDLEKTLVSVDALSRVYRCLHTLKGNCGFLAFSKLEGLAHAGESLLNKLRAGDLTVNTEIATTLLQTIDSIRKILTFIEANDSEGNEDYSNLIQKLNSFHSTSPSKVPASTPLSTTLATDSTYITSETIRVDVDVLDKIMNLVGELILSRNQVLQLANSLDDTAFTKISQNLDLISSELQFVVMKTRLQPINAILQKLPRAVRDIEVASGKRVHLKVIGADTELDRNIIEFIKDPILHIVRNCIDHGIETPEVRTKLGKPIEGKLCVRAFHSCGKVNIEISDDGKGIEAERVKTKALELRLITSLQAQTFTEAEILNLIFLPGLSTSTQVTNLSGRGVGMDVVKTNIERVNGTVQVYSQPGQGTVFKLKIPLTLAIISALIITSNGQYFTIPQTNVQELVRLEGNDISERMDILYDIPVLRLRGNILPLVYLNKVLGFEEVPLSVLENIEDIETIYIVVIKIDGYHFGLIVDSIEDTEDIVVKPLGKQLKNVSIFTGATILGDGKIALIIDANAFALTAGVTTQTNSLSTTLINTSEEREMILLFEGVQNARMGIFITLASRLEEFDSQVIKIIGNQKVVQYNNEIIPLIDLNEVFLGTPQILSDIIQVVIVTLNHRNYGLIVNLIIDIVEEPMKIQGASTRPGVKMLANIQNQIIEILDVEKIINIANPYLIK